MSHPQNPTPAFDFTWEESLSKWNITVDQWKQDNNSTLDGVCVGVVVFNQEGRVLLVQRASHDSMPNRWEIPGGAVDREDPSILYGAARELWEESGLIAKRFRHFVPERQGEEMGQIFTNRYGTKSFCRFVFEAEVESSEAVALDQNEHQAYVWASKDEVQDQRIGERQIPITVQSVQSVILEAFRIEEQSKGE